MREPTANTPRQLAVPFATAINAALDVLDVRSSARRQNCAHFLDAHLRAFILGRSKSQLYPTDHEELQQIRRLKEMLASVIGQLNSIRPSYRAMLTVPDGSVIFTSTDWKNLTELLDRFDARIAPLAALKLPPRRPDTVLEEAVGCLMLRIEEITGKLAHARPANHDKDLQAELSSSEAEAIWLLLNSVDHGLTKGTIANRIVALRRRYKGDLHGRFEHYQFLGSKITHLAEGDPA